MFFYDLFNNYALSLFFIAVLISAVSIPIQVKIKRSKMQLSNNRNATIIEKNGININSNIQNPSNEAYKTIKKKGARAPLELMLTFIHIPIIITLFYTIRQPLTLIMGIDNSLLEVNGLIYQKLVELGINTSDQIFNSFYSQVIIAQDISYHCDAFRNLGIEGLLYIWFRLGSINLVEIPSWQIWNFPWDDNIIMFPLLILFVLPFLSGGMQFISVYFVRRMKPSGGLYEALMVLTPFLLLWFGFILPAAISFYWFMFTALQIGINLYLSKKYVIPIKTPNTQPSSHTGSFPNAKQTNETSYCTSCGSKLQPPFKYCIACGKSVD